MRHDAELGLRLRGHFEVGNEQLAAVIVRPSAGPHQLLAVGRKYGQDIGCLGIADSQRLADGKLSIFDFVTGQPQIVVRPSLRVGMVGPCPDDVRFGGVPVRSPMDTVAVREGGLTLTINSDDVDLKKVLFLTIASEDDPLLIGRHEGATVVTRCIR